jgi:hypothetical protein
MVTARSRKVRNLVLGLLVAGSIGAAAQKVAAEGCAISVQCGNNTTWYCWCNTSSTACYTTGSQYGGCGISGCPGAADGFGDCPY